MNIIKLELVRNTILILASTTASVHALSTEQFMDLCSTRIVVHTIFPLHEVEHNSSIYYTISRIWT